MNPRHPEYAKLRNVLIAKLNLPTDIFQRDNQIAEAVLDVIHERDQLTKLSTDLRTQRDALYERLTQVVDVTGEPTLEELVERLVAERLTAAKWVAELVANEELLINDNTTQPGLESNGLFRISGLTKIEMKQVTCQQNDLTTPKTCLVCAHVTDGTLDNCPQCHTPFGGSDDA